MGTGDLTPIKSGGGSETGGGGAAAPQPADVVTNINAVKIDLEFDDSSTKTYYFFGNQDKPTTPGAETDGVPIRVTAYWAENLLPKNGVDEVTVTASTLIQPPSIKSVNKGDTTSNVTVELKNVTGVSVIFGFEDKAGIVVYDIYDKNTGEFFIEDGEVDLHSTSDTVRTEKSVELADGLDETKTYVLVMKHKGTANATVFDSNQNHPVYIGDVLLHRTANSTQSVVEHISNTAFANTSFIDNGTQNSLTGRNNYVEFFSTQNDIADGNTDTFRVRGSTKNIRSVWIDNGRGFSKLDKNIDWIVQNNSSTDDTDISVVLAFKPKENAAIRIIYDTVGFALQRKIELNQPVTYDGRFDRYTNFYLQNEAVYVELNAEND